MAPSILIGFRPGGHRAALGSPSASRLPTQFTSLRLAELGGLEGRWTPEQLLLCALAACFTTTFEAVARSVKFAYTDLEVEVDGAMRKNKLGCTFAEIVLRPTLTVQSEEEMDEGMVLLRRAKSLCMISRAIAVAQTTEPKVEVSKMPPGGWVAEPAAMKMSV